MSTLTRTSVEGPTLVKRIRPAKILAIAGALVLAAAVGYAINSPETAPAGAAAVVRQSQATDFIYWNTTALERPVAAVRQSSVRGEAFTYWNETALERPAVASMRDPSNPLGTYAESWNGPR